MTTLPRIIGLGRANPATRWTQRELWEHRPWDDPLFDKLFLGSPVRQRALFVPPDWFDDDRSLTESNTAWREGALALGRSALADALDAAAVPAADLGLLAVTTVTGYCTPGLDLLLARAEGLRPDVARAHFNCMGCHAALPTLRTAADHAARHPGEPAVAVAVEVCSACLRNDRDPQNLVALSLFGDGAAAAVVSTEGDGPTLIDFASAVLPEHVDALGFDLTTTGFRIVLDPSVPARLGEAIGEAVDGLLARHGLSRDEVVLWAFHPGGSRILDAVQARLGLPDAAMAPSRRVLAQHGNMSSPSVLFSLAEALSEAPQTPMGPGILAAFGPGLGIELALIGLGG